jgi:5-methylcytosine-specific restriction endonuclease McrA
MPTSYSLSHLTDSVLLRDLTTLCRRDRATTAVLLAHLAEVDARKLYLPAAYPSMLLYCVHELRLSEDAALKRIRAARTARQFPAIFEAVAEGRLHLAAVVLLTPFLTKDNAEELLASAVGRTRSELELLLAERFPRADMPPRLAPIPSPLTLGECAKEVAPGPPLRHIDGCANSLAPGPPLRHIGVCANSLASGRPLRHIAPLSPGRFALQVTISQETHDKLRRAQDLLAHAVPSGEVAQVLDRALDALLRQLESRKCGATSQPSRTRRPAKGQRTVPAQVRRAVWERDDGQCTFVSEAGRRCPSRRGLEYDHLDPVARGGEATVAGIRLRCRAHNQYAAECTFGTTFMQEKREQARAAVAVRQVERAEAAARQAEHVARKERAAEVTPWLRQLGFRTDEAQRGAAACESIADAPLEERVRVALASLARKPLPRPSREPSGAMPGGWSQATSLIERPEVGAERPQAHRAAMAAISTR